MSAILAMEQPYQQARVLTWRNAALLALAAFMFIAVRPNTGVRHDAILYAAQALYRIYPEIFGQDLFFKFGSQENFTVFGRLFAFLITQLGFTGATLFLLVLAQVLFFVGTLAWVRTALPRPLVFAGLLAACASSGTYGGLTIFHYAEPFVTARPFAEILVVLALPLLLVGKRWAALALLLAAAAFHPLMALPALVIWWVMQVLQDRRWAWLALPAAALALALAGAGVPPFTNLLVRQNDEWRAAIELHTAQVFVLEWTWFDYAMLATDVLILAWARLLSQGRLRLLLTAVLAAGAGLFAISIVGADLWSNVLVVGLQLWRVGWLMHFLAMTLLPIVVLPLLRGTNVQLLCAMLLVYAAVNRGLPTGALALLGMVILVAAERRKPFEIDRKLVYVVGLALVGGMAVLWNNNASWDLRSGEVAGNAYTLLESVLHYVRKPAFGPLLVVAACLAVMWRWPRSAWPALGVIAVAAALSAITWDQRTPWSRVLEAHALGDHPFTKHIGAEQEVYWAGQALAPWLMLHRRTYVSGPQQAGLAFNKDTARQLERRNNVISMFDFQAEICRMFNAVKGEQQDACEPDLMTLRTACETDANLSFVIIQNALENAWIDSWQSEVNGRPFRKYYLYSCRRLLASDKGKAP